MNRLSRLPCRSATEEGFVYIVGLRGCSNQAGSRSRPQHVAPGGVGVAGFIWLKVYTMSHRTPWRSNSRTGQRGARSRTCCGISPFRTRSATPPCFSPQPNRPISYCRDWARSYLRS